MLRTTKLDASSYTCMIIIYMIALFSFSILKAEEITPPIEEKKQPVPTLSAEQKRANAEAVRNAARDQIIQFIDLGISADIEMVIFGRRTVVHLENASDDGLEVDFDEEFIDVSWEDINDKTLGEILLELAKVTGDALACMRAGILIRLGGDEENGYRIIQKAFDFVKQGKSDVPIEKLISLKESVFGNSANRFGQMMQALRKADEVKSQESIKQKKLPPPHIIEMASKGAIKWKFYVESYIQCSPALAPDGTIYIGCGGNKFFAIDKSGNKKWEFIVPGGDNILSTPAIDSENRIYFGGGADNCLYALNPDGTLVWKFQAEGDGRTDCSPAIGPDGTIYFAANKEGTEGEWKARFYAINPDGTKKWMIQTKYCTDTSPAIGPDGTIYLHTWGGDTIALNPEKGQKKWEIHKIWGDWSSPAIGSDGTIYVGAGDGLDAITPQGRAKWHFIIEGGTSSSPAIGPDGTIYVGSSPKSGKLYAINPDGTEKWAFFYGGGVGSPAVTADGTIYIGGGGFGNNPKIKNSGKFFAVNSDGSQRCMFQKKGSFFSSPTIGPDGTIYVASLTGIVYAFYGFAGLADSSWPMFCRDPQRTGCMPPGKTR